LESLSNKDADRKFKYAVENILLDGGSGRTAEAQATVLSLELGEWQIDSLAGKSPSRLGLPIDAVLSRF